MMCFIKEIKKYTIFIFYQAYAFFKELPIVG